MPENASPDDADPTRWTISQDEALRIARARMEGPDSERRYEHLIYGATYGLRDGRRVWQVSGTSMIAGGWEVDVDGETGAILHVRRLPGR